MNPVESSNWRYFADDHALTEIPPSALAARTAGPKRLRNREMMDGKVDIFFLLHAVCCSNFVAYAIHPFTGHSATRRFRAWARRVEERWNRTHRLGRSAQTLSMLLQLLSLHVVHGFDTFFDNFTSDNQLQTKWWKASGPWEDDLPNLGCYISTVPHLSDSRLNFNIQASGGSDSCGTMRHQQWNGEHSVFFLQFINI
jgi:hypothetical protein